MGLIIGFVVSGLLIGGIIILNIILALIRGTMQNIVIADALIIAGTVIYFVYNNGIHMVFSILLGLAAGVCFVFLTRIPYFGKPFVVLCGLGWTFGLYQLIDDFGIFYQISNSPDYVESDHALTMLLKEDPIWWWTLVILVVIIFVGLHLKCVLKSEVDENTELQPQPQIQPQIVVIERTAANSPKMNVVNLDDDLEDIDELPKDVVPYDMSESYVIRK